jgi:dTDP-4-amino-4,6-dideoxygalactose transaminase
MTPSIGALLKQARDVRKLSAVDTAQAAGAMYKGRHAGTVGDIGIFSLNRHKNMQCGEGGVAVTHDPELALRMSLIRNHGENLVESPGYIPKDLSNMVGLNLRMTEVEAAIAHEQLKKIEALNRVRLEHVEHLNARLAGYPGLVMPGVRPGCTHVYYMHAMKLIEPLAGCSRDAFTHALNAEGIPIRGGYVRPLYLEPLFQKRIAIGGKGFPFVGPHYGGTTNYSKGICPVAEDLYENKTLINAYVYPPLTRADMDDIVAGIDKVLRSVTNLRT